MTALWIIPGIVAFLVLLSALLLVLPLRIFLSYSEEKGLQYRVKYAVFRLADSEKPAKAESSKKQSVVVKKLKKATVGAPQSLLSFLGLEDISSVANAKRAIDEKGLLETLHSVTEAVGSLFKRTGRLLKKGVFQRFDLRIVCGDGDPADAAMQYGTVCAAVYPLLTLLDSTMKCKRRKVDIRCDFNTEGTQASFTGQVNYRPWHFVCFVCGMLRQYLKRNTVKEG